MREYRSANYAKHTNPNPLQQWLIDRFHKVVTNMLSRAPVGRLLEVGCGEGFSSEIVRQGAAVDAFYALDVSVPALRVAKTRVDRVGWVGASVLDLPFADGSFDAVVCLEVLEHLGDPAQGLSELSRVARSYLVLSVPNEPFFRGANFLRGKNLRSWGDDPGHVQHWSYWAFRALVGHRLKILGGRVPFPWTVLLCQKVSGARER